MMNKFFKAYVVFALAILIGINIYQNIDENVNKLSDQEMMDKYIEHVLGDGCHGELLPDDGDEYVEFIIYDDEKGGRIVHPNWCFEREYFEDRIAE